MVGPTFPLTQTNSYYKSASYSYPFTLTSLTNKKPEQSRKKHGSQGTGCVFGSQQVSRETATRDCSSEPRRAKGLSRATTGATFWALGADFMVFLQSRDSRVHSHFPFPLYNRFNRHGRCSRKFQVQNGWYSRNRLGFWWHDICSRLLHRWNLRYISVLSFGWWHVRISVVYDVSA